MSAGESAARPRGAARFQAVVQTVNIGRDIQLARHFTATHATAGLPDFKAYDAFAPAGSYVLAPEAGRLVWPHMIAWDEKKRVGGMTCYLAVGEKTKAERWYFLTHFGSLRHRGHYRGGEVLGIVGAVPHSSWTPHIHVGLHLGPYRTPQP